MFHSSDLQPSKTKYLQNENGDLYFGIDIPKPVEPQISSEKLVTVSKASEVLAGLAPKIARLSWAIGLQHLSLP